MAKRRSRSSIEYLSRRWLSAAVEVSEKEHAAGQTAPAVDALLGLQRSRRRDRDERRHGGRHGRRQRGRGERWRGEWHGRRRRDRGERWRGEWHGRRRRRGRYGRRCGYASLAREVTGVAAVVANGRAPELVLNSLRPSSTRKIAAVDEIAAYESLIIIIVMFLVIDPAVAKIRRHQASETVLVQYPVRAYTETRRERVRVCVCVCV